MIARVDGIFCKTVELETKAERGEEEQVFCPAADPKREYRMQEATDPGAE
jgi:hypothetical protein